MAKKCSGCGADLPENVKFCIKCDLFAGGNKSQNLSDRLASKQQHPDRPATIK